MPDCVTDSKESISRTLTVGLRGGHAQDLRNFETSLYVIRRATSNDLTFWASTTPIREGPEFFKEGEITLMDLEISLHVFRF